MDWELSFLDLIQELFKNDVMDALMPAVSALGNGGICWILLALILLLIPRTRRMGLACAAALILMLVTGNMILKPLVGRLRPFTVNTAVELLIPPPADFSFPSGHTFASFAAAAAILKSSRRLGIPALILAVLIAFSRLYLYVHYPTDVLCGALLGIGAGLIGDRLAGWAAGRFGWGDAKTFK